MANTISALKRVRAAERRTVINRMRKTRLRHQIRIMRRFLEKKDVDGAQKSLPETFSLVDRAAKWGIIRSAVVKTGKATFGSVKKMIDHFSAKPSQTWGE